MVASHRLGIRWRSGGGGGIAPSQFGDRFSSVWVGCSRAIGWVSIGVEVP